MKKTNLPVEYDRLVRARERAKADWGSRGWGNLTPEMRKAHVALALVADFNGCDPQYAPKGADILAVFDLFMRGEES